MLTTEQLETFRAALESKMQAHHNKLPYNYHIALEVGPKYARIVRFEVLKDGAKELEHSRSAYGFIDLANGDLLYANGWKAPKKGARGNIIGEDILSGCGPNGVKMARGYNQEWHDAR